MNTGPDITSPESTFDMGRSPAVSINALKPDSNEVYPPSHTNTGQNKNSLTEIDLEPYPTKFRPLIKAILQLSDNRTNVQVGFEAIRQLMGKREDVQALNPGFTTFTSMVNQASQEKCVEQGGTESSGKWLALLPVCFNFSSFVLL
jgi:hypothetical protein